MSKLKTWTTATLVFGMFLLLAFPFLLLRRPDPEAPRAARAQFAVVLTSYTVLLLVVFFVVIVLAWRVIGEQRGQYKRERIEKLKELGEGTLHDHQRKQEDDGS